MTTTDPTLSALKSRENKLDKMKNGDNPRSEKLHT